MMKNIKGWVTEKTLKGILLSNQIDKVLSIAGQMIRNPYDLKEKDNLVKLYTYISPNRQGIANQFKLKDKGIELSLIHI